MGYSFTEQTAETADDLRPAGLSRPSAKTPIGAPFGRAILSTKYWEADTKLAYYGYRFYSPMVGKWLSRDPIGEKTGPNLSKFVFNQTCSSVDTDGRRIWMMWVIEQFFFPPKIRDLFTPNPIPNVWEIPSIYDANDLGNEESFTFQVRKCTLHHQSDNCLGLNGMYTCVYDCKVFVRPFNWPDEIDMGLVSRTRDFGCCNKPNGCPPYPDEPQRTFFGDGLRDWFKAAQN
jgi:RHS repeat-associated protein